MSDLSYMNGKLSYKIHMIDVVINFDGTYFVPHSIFDRMNSRFVENSHEMRSEKWQYFSPEAWPQPR